MGKLDAKVAVISGAAQGLGAAIARRFAAEGAHVVVLDVLEKQGRAVTEEIGGLFVECDVRSQQQWQNALAQTEAHFGAPAILINNAGLLQVTPIRELSLDAYMDVIGVNQVGTFLGIRTVAPLMQGRGGGAIVNIASLASFRASAGTMAYTAAKFAVRGMTKVAAIELGQWGIRVNSLHPGAMRTEMATAMAARQGFDLDAHFSRLPIGRIAEPEDIARAALFLASDDSAICTGTEFVADGGELAGISFLAADAQS